MEQEKLFSLLESGMEELGWDSARVELDDLRKSSVSGAYFVAFVGRFSAGKSYLLNNLLGRELLPQGRVETTPLLTYIRYGKEEKGLLYYDNGQVQEISLADVGEIMQTNDGSRWDLSVIEHIEVLLDVSMLEKGMILLDTPGINTLIERHERLLARSLALASSIVYVAGGTPSKLDAEKMEGFVERGIPLVFVRTHCDEIRPMEESYEEIVSHERGILATCGMDKTQSFFVSNVAESPYYAGIAEFRKLLGKMGVNVQQALSEAVSGRLEVMCQSVVKGLEELREHLAAAKNGEDAALKERRDKIDADLKRLTDLLEERKLRLQKEAQTCQADLQKELRQSAVKAAEKIAYGIETSGDDVCSNEEMAAFIQRMTRQVLQETFSLINRHIDPLLKDVNGELQLDDFSMELSELPEMGHYGDVAVEQDASIAELSRQLACLRENRGILEKQLAAQDKSPALLEWQEEIRKLEQEIVDAQEEYAELGEYIPQMVEVDAGNNEASSMGKFLGNVLDWAMIFMPAGTFTKMVKAPKTVKALAKVPTMMGKYSSAVAKGITQGKSAMAVVSNVKNVSKTYATAKRVKNAVEMLDKGGKLITQVAKKAKENAPASVLEYFTLSHWGEEIGKCFDEPPRYEEDEVYRQEFQAKKKFLERKLQEKQEKLFRQKQELGLYKSKEEEKKALHESLQVDEAELSRQIEEHRREWQLEAKKKALKEWKHKWAVYCQGNMERYLLEKTAGYLAAFPERLQAYQAKRFFFLEEKLAEKRKECERIAQMQPGGAEEQLERVESLLTELQQGVVK